MKIVYIAPGTGGQFYCQNCMRDAGLVKALRALRHDVVLAPMYLPLAVDDPQPTGDAPVFYGAVNCYLKQKFSAFRRLPDWLQQALDSRPVLRFAARRSGTTDARGLEEMTISVLKGDDGNQREELERLLAWLKVEKPDVVHLSNALLLGLAPRIRRELGCALVCSLQDELPWIRTMEGGAVDTVRDLLTEKAQAVDAFMPVSAYYAGLMQPWLKCPDDALHVVHIGIDPDGYRMAERGRRELRLGFLSRTGPGQGLEALVDAFVLLKKRPSMAGLRLAVTGGTPPQDRRFVRSLRKRLEHAGFLEHTEFIDDFGRERRQAFLAGLSVLSVPAPGGDAFGLCLVEALASGVPVVQPREGSAVEIVNESGGGVLCRPGSVADLAEALGALLSDSERRRELGEKGRRYVLNNLTNERLAVQVAAVYESAKEHTGTARRI
jgi:glycosyltransferase involved in cell wall biosynthesis